MSLMTASGQQFNLFILNDMERFLVQRYIFFSVFPNILPIIFIKSASKERGGRRNWGVRFCLSWEQCGYRQLPYPFIPGAAAPQKCRQRPNYILEVLIELTVSCIALFRYSSRPGIQQSLRT